MRVTQFTYYNNFITNQQSELNELNKVQTQLATGKKIENIYDEPIIYAKDLEFKEDINSFLQIKKSANFAKTFTNETDTALQDMTKTLTSFKTKLLNAANDTNNDKTRESIVKELQADLIHLKDLANTSINGKYLFAGSEIDKKPVDDDFKYQGNDKKLKAFLGEGVERTYNIDGKSLFLGRDDDYIKHTTLNVIQYDKLKANREFVVRGDDGKLYIDKHIKEHGKVPDSTEPNINEPIGVDSEIRSLTGVEDKYDSTTDTYSDGTSYFYLKGKKPNGENFFTKFSLSNSDSVNDLLNKIGEAFGNSVTSKVVDVSLNSMGEIQIKNTKNGKMINDFFMVASNKDENSIDDLVKNGDYIVRFQQSKFNSTRNETQIKASNKDFDNRIFKFASTFKLMDNSRDAVSSDLIQNVIGVKAYDPVNKVYSTIDHLNLTGTDTSGNSVNINLSITSSTTMNDLINEIKNNFGDVNVSLENGKLIVTDNTISKTESSKLSLSIAAQDSSNNNLEAFRSDDIVNSNNLYMQKKGNILTSNVSQIQKDKIIYYKDNQKIVENNPNAQQFATKDTVLMNVIGDDATPKDINLNFKDINGNEKKAKIELRDTIKSMPATYEASSNNEILMDTTKNSNATNRYYETMGRNIVDENGKNVEVKYLKISDGSTTIDIALDDNTTFNDIVNNSGGLLTGYSNGKFTTSSSNVTITLQDANQNDITAGFKSNYQIDLNNDGKISYGEIFNIFNDKGELTPAHTQIKTISTLDPVTCELCQSEKVNKGVTFKQLGDVVSMLGSDEMSPNSFDVYNQNLKHAQNNVSVDLNNKGELVVNDNTSISSAMDISMFASSLTSAFFDNEGVSVNNSGSSQKFSITINGEQYSMNVDNNESVGTFINDINSGKLVDSSGNSLNLKAYYKSSHIYLDFSNINGEIDNIDDSNLVTDFKNRDDNSFTIQENNAITIDEPQTDFFGTLQKAIDAVKNGQNYANADSKDPRNFGIQGAIEAIEHVMDRVRREDSTIGAISEEFDMTIQRVDMLKNHVTVLQSENIDVDIGEASTRLNSLTLSYQALLASISKINNLTLLNYLR